MKFLVGLLIFFTFWGSSFPMLSISGIAITPFRVILLLVSYLFVIEVLHNNRNLRFRLSKTKLLLLFFIINLLITLVFMESIHYWFTGFLHIITILIISVILIYYTRTERDIIYYIKFLGWGSLLTILISIYEIGSGIHVAANYTNAYSVGSFEYNALIKAPTALLFNPNNVAVVIVLFMPCVEYLFPKKISRLPRLTLLGIYYILAFYVLLNTGSRSGIIISLFYVIIRMLLNFKISIGRFLFLLITGIVTLFIIYKNMGTVIDSLQYSGLIDASNSLVLFTKGDSVRFDLIISGLRLWLENYLMGGGPWFHESIINFPTHAFWIDVLVDFGIIGFTILIYFYLKIIYYLFKNIKNKLNKDIVVMLLLFLPLSFTPPTIYTLYGVFIPLILGFAQIKTKNMS